MKDRIAPSASARVAATTTPLPAASPSALTAKGDAPFSAKCFRVWVRAFSMSEVERLRAARTPYFFMKALEKALLASSTEARASGPTTARPRALNRSTIPAAKGASGPITVSSTPSALAKVASASWASGAAGSPPGTARFRHFPSRAVPPFPGATNTRSTLSLCANFHASACSLPPLPMIKTFIYLSNAHSRRIYRGSRARKAGAHSVLGEEPSVLLLRKRSPPLFSRTPRRPATARRSGCAGSDDRRSTTFIGSPPRQKPGIRQSIAESRAVLRRRGGWPIKGQTNDSATHWP